MIISSIVAVAKNNVIGLNNKMPWHIPADLKYFKETTLGHIVIMGRKNFESIGKPLPNRTNIILTRNKSFFRSDCVIFDSIEKAIFYAKNEGEKELFIIGGAEIYKQSIEYWDRIYITEIDLEVEGDKYFPELNYDNWQLENDIEYKKSEKSKYDLHFKLYNRISE